MGRTVGSSRGLPCSEVLGRDVQREQLPVCTPLPTGSCCCTWISDVLLKLCATNEHLPAPAPPALVHTPLSQAQGTGALSPLQAFSWLRTASWEDRQW